MSNNIYGKSTLGRDQNSYIKIINAILGRIKRKSNEYTVQRMGYLIP
jgi:hypothetical protein